MHVTVFGVGSRGDVQPLIALAIGLERAGYRVRFATHQDFEPLVRSHGLDFHRLSGNAAAFFSGPAGVALRDRSRRDPKEYRRFFNDYLGAFSERLLVESYDACQDTNAVLSWPWTRVAPTLAEYLQIPNFLVSVTPVVYLATREFPNPFQGEFRPELGAEYNLETWQQVKPFFQAGQEQLHRWRRKLGMPIHDIDEEFEAFRRLPHLFGFSEHVLPKPADWPDVAHLTGYWFLDHVRDYQPPDDLLEFLNAGPPPIVVGFGSQVGRKPQESTRVVIDAVRMAGKRAILISGWGGLKSAELPDSIFKVSTVPYDWLLPQVAAIVHHGGAGSTSAAFRAGKPSVAIPFGWEQPLWGHRIHALGVGARPIPAAELDTRELAEAMVRITEDESIARKARELGEELGREDGVARAVELISRTLGKPAPGKPAARDTDARTPENHA